MPIRLQPYLMIIILLLNQWFAASALASHSHVKSQSMSAVDMTVCNMAQGNMIQGMDMSNMAHGIAEVDSAQNTNDKDCCEHDCSCPASACSSAALINIAASKLNLNSSFVLLNYEFSSLTASLSLLQKPPQA
ncbi:hypothetical protein AX660_02290 [Paraglaciecola hydrolytica]|uniref:Uncharacterized protein n=2 Tax=Paraglaciecola hydrolytica TaxID=1799789 RepID=A0A148KKX2_9ALTE|nr:hypothetical protein AX660_02290 [Paraglaciecola hydrolytica]